MKNRKRVRKRYIYAIGLGTGLMYLAMEQHIHKGKDGLLRRLYRAIRRCMKGDYL